MKSVLRRLAVSFITFAVVACSPSTPSGTVDRFYRLVEGGKYDAAFALFTVQSRAAFPAEKAKALLVDESRKLNAGGGINAITFSDETITGETAVVTSLITMKNGETKSDKTRLAREDGEWLMEMGK